MGYHIKRGSTLYFVPTMDDAALEIRIVPALGFGLPKSTDGWYSYGPNTQLNSNNVASVSGRVSALAFVKDYHGTGSESVFSINAANSGSQDRYDRQVKDGLESELTLTGDAFVASILARLAE